MAETTETAELPVVPAGADEVTAAVPEATAPEAAGPEAAGSGAAGSGAADAEAAVPEVAGSEAAGPEGAAGADEGATARGASGSSNGSGAGSDEPGAVPGGSAGSGGSEGLDGAGDPHGAHGPGGPGGAAGTGGAGGSGGAGTPRWPHGYGGGDGDDEPGGEEELRLLLHSAVDGLEPAPGTLQYLQRAVPARRTRRRQLIAVAAVAVVALAVSVPALMNVAGSTSEKNPRHDIANSQLPSAGQQGGGGAVEGNDSDATAGSEEPKDEEEKTESPGHEENTAAPTGGSEGTAAAEPCAPTQVSEPVAASGTPDEAGRVTGSFTVTNVSTTACVVESSDGVQVGGTFGAASASEVDTRTHTVGDAATDLLPSPETTGALVLAAGESYVVEFAWVPETSRDGGCTTTATTPAPDPSDGTQSSPDETQSEPDQGTETGGDTGGTGEPGEGDDTTDGSVTLTHSPEADSSAVASVTVENACAGTVYYTEPLPSA
ncbi:hypothetical protein O7599_21345 [Streptomyces sp. WMMC500]|uniref:hypothetical protein n=1 Tax=Streptomyces sp. WMMC500 TaxID=3015154 RepID=UPI00248BFCDB|nr:hypothetical protein [Streptomyces sp. WMMC500]WBB58187.1 hypothetical protein O7599_21345 [Streptomyces sp. WMMC500]